MSASIETLYILHHSHTDIGYTHDQPVVWELQRRFLDEALRLAAADGGRDGDDCFRWTVETTGPLLHWLEHAAADDRQRLRALNAAGRIAIGAMPLNITPLYDSSQILEALRAVDLLRREHGLTVRHAMNCDVNGENWPLVDLLLDAGVEGFSMAINEHFGGSPLRRPNAFWWEGPSGRRLLAWNGWPYNKGHDIGIGWDAQRLEQEWWPRIQTHLDMIDYPLPILMVQMYHPFGDNGSANPRIGPFVAAWNAAGKRPRLRMSTLTEWFDALQQHADRLPVYRGDWTDYWNFGAISSAREQGINRESRTRLVLADGLRAIAGAFERAPSPGDLPAGADELGATRLRDAAWRALNLWDEHTWGADLSIREPESEDTRMQWLHKAAYAAEARSLSLLLQRDAVAGLARRVAHSAATDLLVFNGLPWTRRLAGPVSDRILAPRGGADDPTAARHFQDRIDAPASRLLPPTEAPGFGYVVVPAAALVARDDDQEQVSGESAVVENHRYRLSFDRVGGGIRSWWDKQLQRELVDQAAEWRFGSFIYEAIAGQGADPPRHRFWRRRPDGGAVEPPRGWNPDWRAERHAPQRLLAHRVRHTPLGIEVEQLLAVDELPSAVRLRFRLPSYADHLECEASWEMGLTTRPEATYLAFPFAVPAATCRLDLGGQAMEPEREQIAGSCRDYYTVQRWIDCSNAEFGVTLACPLNPLVQLGDFRFGANLAEHSLPRSLVLGWITNNYWETNFRAHQPGRVEARYWIAPHAGAFDEAACHRFGLEAAFPPIFQTLGEAQAAGTRLPAAASLLDLPQPPVVVLSLRPGREPGTAEITLVQAAQRPGMATIAPGVVRFARAYRCDRLGHRLEELPLSDGAIHLALQPRQLATICLAGLSLLDAVDRSASAPGRISAPPAPELASR